jgi:PTS system nitrogen regulatory IIA component
MKLSDMLDEDQIVPDLKAKDKKGALEELTDALVAHEPSLERGSLVKILLERERLGSTGIGDGVAIPHGKFHGISRPILSFGGAARGWILNRWTASLPTSSSSWWRPRIPQAST